MLVPDGPLLPLTEGRSFSSIQHLGAEIHLIRDMMDPIHTGGLYDFLLTALEVRDRNAPVAGQTPSLPQPPPWGWAHSHSRLACLRGRGVLTEPLSLPLLKEAWWGGHSAPQSWGPQDCGAFQAVSPSTEEREGSIPLQTGGTVGG